jgi:hypothetical protein
MRLSKRVGVERTTGVGCGLWLWPVCEWATC